MKKKIEIDTFLSFQFVSAPNFSPDGTKAAFILSQASDKENTYKSNIYLLDVATKEIRPMTSMGDASGYTWTPENTLLFQTKRTKEDKESQDAIFYELDPRGGEARKAFTLNIKAGGIRFITDDLLVVSAMENIGQPLKDRDYEIIDETPFWFNGRGFTHGLRSRLYTYNRKTGELNPITEPAFNAHVSDVKNGLILYQGAPWEKGKRYDSDGVYLYDAQTGETRCVLEPNVLQSYYSVMFWGDGSIMTLATAEDENPGMAYPNFYRMDKENGKLELFASWAQTIGTSVGTDARFGGGESERMLGDKWYFVSTQADTATIRSIHMTTGEISGDLETEICVDSFDMTPDHTLICGLKGNQLAELYLDGEQVTHFNDDFAADYDIRTPEFHSFTNSDGIEIHGWAMKPAGWEEGKQYPCILHIHGGPRTVFGSVYHHEMQMWANAGFYVIYCNPRGSDGRGYAFSDICDKYGTIDYQDIMEFTDAMLEKYPDIDRERLGVTGGSYGGFMTNWIIGHTDRFKAACSQRSIANWTVFEHTSDIGYSFTKYHQGARTRDNVEQLWDHSPLKYADKCTTPTLFIHSDRDYRCWMAEGISMFNALQVNGCDSRIVLFHDETHELSRSGKPKNRIKRMEEIRDWMKKYLMDTEEKQE